MSMHARAHVESIVKYVAACYRSMEVAFWRFSMFCAFWC
jgi:hypothetical protein